MLCSNLRLMPSVGCFLCLVLARRPRHWQGIYWICKWYLCSNFLVKNISFVGLSLVKLTACHLKTCYITLFFPGSGNGMPPTYAQSAHVSCRAVANLRQLPPKYMHVNFPRITRCTMDKASARYVRVFLLKFAENFLQPQAMIFGKLVDLVFLFPLWRYPYATLWSGLLLPRFALCFVGSTAIVFPHMKVEYAEISSGVCCDRVH